MNIDHYMKQVNRYSTITRQEEQELARKSKAGDTNARKALINSHLRLVVKLALKLSNKRYNLMECIQEGNIGLIIAAEKFDPERGFRFMTFATHWIRAYICKYMMNSHALVKICTTRSERKMFFNLKAERADLDDGTRDALQVREALAKRLNETVEKVSFMEVRLDRSEQSLNAPLTPGDENSDTFQDLLQDGHSLENEVIDRIDHDTEVALFNEAVQSIGLDKRKVDMLLSHFGGDTLQTVASRYDICRERVRQIEKESIAKIKNYCEN